MTSHLLSNHATYVMLHAKLSVEEGFSNERRILNITDTLITMSTYMHPFTFMTSAWNNKSTEQQQIDYLNDLTHMITMCSDLHMLGLHDQFVFQKIEGLLATIKYAQMRAGAKPKAYAVSR